MDSKFFDIPCLTEELKEDVMREYGGIRVVIPNIETKHNPIRRKKRDEQICNKRLAGETIEEISNTLNLSIRQVIRILKRNKINTRREKKQSLVEEVRTMLSLGYSVAEIGRKTRKTRAWIHEIIKIEGLK